MKKDLLVRFLNAKMDPRHVRLSVVKDATTITAYINGFTTKIYQVDAKYSTLCKLFKMVHEYEAGMLPRRFKFEDIDSVTCLFTTIYIDGNLVTINLEQRLEDNHDITKCETWKMSKSVFLDRVKHIKNVIYKPLNELLNNK